MRIEEGGLNHPEVIGLLNEHWRNMRELSPEDSCHVLDLGRLDDPQITFWSVWEAQQLLGCGALKEIDREHGEVKSMRVPLAHRQKGVARLVLSHIVAVARERRYARLSLETGSMDAFRPAQRLYESAGFVNCGPFAGYREDPNSVFMTLLL